MIQNTEEPMTEDPMTEEPITTTTLSKNGKRLWPRYGELVQQIGRKLDPGGSRVIACAGLIRGEGASTIATNLAIAFSITNEQPVLLLNATERASSAERGLGVRPEEGLEQVVAEAAELPDVIAPTLIRDLDYLGCGLKNRETFSPFLMSRFPAVLESLKNRYHMVVVDLPAVDQPSSGGALVNAADGVVLVMQPGHVKAGKAQRIQQSLQRGGANVLGVVMNRYEEN